MACAGAVFLLAPLGSLLTDGWDAESFRNLLLQVAQVAVIVLLGHVLVTWRLGKVSWAYSILGQLAVWTLWAASAGAIDGSVTNVGEVVWGILVVGLPITLIALGLRALIAPWRPDSRLRDEVPKR